MADDDNNSTDIAGLGGLKDLIGIVRPQAKHEVEDVWGQKTRFKAAPTTARLLDAAMIGYELMDLAPETARSRAQNALAGQVNMKDLFGVLRECRRVDGFPEKLTELWDTLLPDAWAKVMALPAEERAAVCGSESPTVLDAYTPTHLVRGLRPFSRGLIAEIVALTDEIAPAKSPETETETPASD